MLRAIIIDDEKKGINLLHIIINEFVKDVRVVADTTKASEAISLIENYKPEIVFLDINMPGMNGFELLEKLTWKKFNLIFVTAHEEYAIQALKSNAMDYLLKPVDHNDLVAAVEKIKNKTTDNDALVSLKKYTETVNQWSQATAKNKIFFNLKTGIQPVLFSDIICFESKSNYTLVHLANSSTILVSRNLKSFEDELNSDNALFMRVHNSYIVNTQKVTQYLKSDECIIMANGQQIPLSRSKRKLFFDWLNN